jgi:hypothetical protein
VGEELEGANLYAVAEQLARAAMLANRRKYAAIYRSFGDWLREHLGRPPTVADLDADAIASYARSSRPRAIAPAARHTRRRGCKVASASSARSGLWPGSSPRLARRAA